MSEHLERPEAHSPAAGHVEAQRRELLERFGADFVGLVDHMGLFSEAHVAELLEAGPGEQHRLAMAWLNAATKLEADWAAQSRRPGGSHVSLARYMELRLPSPRVALQAQQLPQAQQEHQALLTAAAPAAAPPTPRDRESARRRIRLERAIAEARAALLRVDALDSLVGPDRQAVVAQLEDLMSLLSRRLRSATPGGEPE
jgi:hypothetical protein